MANKYATVTGSGTKAGDTWANAFAAADLFADFGAGAAAADHYFVEQGTYTLVAGVSTGLDGTSDNPIRITGVVTGTSAEPPTTADWPTTDADWPLIAAGANSYDLDNYWISENVQLTTTASRGWRQDTGAQFRNCKSTNSSGTADRPAFRFGSFDGLVLGCEGISTNGYAFHCEHDKVNMFRCYAHDSKYGFAMLAGHSDYCVMGSVIADCSVAGIIALGAGVERVSVIGNTIDSCVTGISLTDSGETIVEMNNITNNTTKGIAWGSAIGSAWADWNNYFGNTGGDVSNIAKGPNASAVDPSYADAGSGNYQPQVVVLGPATLPGELTPNKQQIGAVQIAPGQIRLLGLTV